MRIEIEGIDGSGKSTGLEFLASQLNKKGKVLKTKEVGNQNLEICKKLRQIVLSPESNLSGEAMEFIFCAMRMENEKYYKLVESDYNFILSDRGILSHLAYTDHNVSKDFTKDLYLDLILKYTDMPDIVVYFDINPDQALKRRVSRGEVEDAIELKGLQYQKNVYDSFMTYMENKTLMKKTRIFNIDASQDLKNVQKDLEVLADKLTLHL